MGQRWRGGRAITRGVIVFMAWSFFVGAAGVTVSAAGASVSEPPDWVDDLADGTESPEPVGWEPAESVAAPVPDDVPDAAPLAEAERPDAGAWNVRLGDAGEVAAPANGAEHAVEVVTAADGVAGDRLRVEVYDDEMADRVGASGFVFGLSDPTGSGSGDGALRQAADEALPTRLSVDYSAFAEAFGASYSDRLQVVALPDCVLEDPMPEDCASGGVAVPTRIDRDAETVTVEVDDLAGLAADGPQADVPADVAGSAGDSPLDGSDDGGDEPGAAPRSSADLAAARSGGVLFALTSVVSGPEGTYAATPASQTAQWQVSAGSGEFSYSYDLDLPKSAAGTSPELSLAYSSGSIDGLTNASNTQGGPTGLGWSQFDGAYIERRYDPCVTYIHSEDLCWAGQNAILSLGSVSGTMLPIDTGATQWRVHTDAGWKVERLTGADNGDGDMPGVDDPIGEHWKVTATDGTQYFFGLGKNPDTAEVTSSTALVPVFADQPGEPCQGNVGTQFGVCDQPWRWNLDRIIDPDGNVTSYFYDRGTNRYNALNGFFPGTTYHRSTLLQRIDYGGRAGTGPGSQATVKVDFQRWYRCLALDPTCTTAPTDDANTTGADEPSNFPDIPGDLICSTSTCTAHAPSFFNTSRYDYVESSVRVGTGVNDWKPVTRYNLFHQFGQVTGSPLKMVLRSIQHVGRSNPALPLGHPLPSTTFEFEWLPNRVDVDESQDKLPMPHPRIDKVTNEFGGTVDVVYGQNRSCLPTYILALWETNDRDCFPQTTIDDGARSVGIFNKYLVTQITENAGFLTTPMVTSYAYEGTPAWAFNYGSVAQYDQEWGWTRWRGYGTTTITKGASKTKVRVFRGLEGDPLWVDLGGNTHCACGVRHETVAALEGPGTYTDYASLGGRTLEEAGLGTLNGTPNSILHSTRYEYQRQVTYPAGSGQGRDAEWAGVSSVTETVATGGATPYRRQRTTGYTLHPQANFMQATSSLQEGWLDVPGDERCTLTTYANNLTAWMFEYPASDVTVAGTCASTTEVSKHETYYDDSLTLGALPNRGNPTRSRTKLDASHWAETLTDFDALGRPTAVTDPNGSTTTTQYTATPSHAIPTESKVTNELGHETTTVWVPEYQVPQSEEDANGNLTNYGYDGLGRLIAVRQPTEQPYVQGKEPSWRFTYGADLRSVKSSQLTSAATSGTGVNFEETWVLYDGFGREWQVQSRSPDGAGKVLVSQTGYDDRGLVLHRTQPQAVTGTLGSLVLPTWDNITRYAYDELGRQIREEWLQGSSVTRTTELAYTPDTVTVIGPDGHQVRDTVDGLGRTSAVAEHDGTNWVSSTYTYDLADNLRTITDPAGNQTEYTYDLAGRRTTQDDPNRGTRELGYDAAGNITSVEDGLGNAVQTSYDELGRPDERRAGSPTGTLLASWDYDTLQLGKLDSETRHTAGDDWLSSVTGYDARGRVLGTELTVPSGNPGLQGTYTTNQTYDRADRVTSTTYPAAGGLAQETVTTTYDNLGLPTGMLGAAPYVRTTEHDGRGRLTGAAFGPAGTGNAVWMAKSWDYDADQQLAATETYAAGSSAPNGIVSRHELGYDDAGNLRNRTTILDGEDWRECFEHDSRQRLTRAYTIEVGATCAVGQPGGTGDQPYERLYAYHPDGRLNARTDVIDPDWGDLILYGYPTGGTAPPQAPTTVGTDSYEWDANGNLTERTVGGQTEVLDWDVEQNLASVQDTGGTTAFTYDVGGQRLLRRTDDGATLYLPGQEVTANAAGTTVTAVRSYSFEGELVATRTPGGVSYMVTDDAGSVEMAVESGGAPTASRAYLPYGEVRAEDGTMATDRGFLGQVEDETTDLSYLQNRYYDATTGLFVSADPVYDTRQIRTLNPFTYAAGNPTTMADPTGLSPSYIHGLEVQNRALRDQNTQLRDIITRLGNQIEEMQGIIRKQNRLITQLVNRVKALETIVEQQQSVIRTLVNRVNTLIGIVESQRVTIGRLQAKVRSQRKLIEGQAWLITAQRSMISDRDGIIFGMVDYFWEWQWEKNEALASIASGNRYPGSLTHRVGSNYREKFLMTVGAATGEISRLNDEIARLESQADDVSSDSPYTTDNAVAQQVCTIVEGIDFGANILTAAGRETGGRALAALEVACAFVE